MGAKTWMLVLADRSPREVLTAGPRLDREATKALAAKLFPNDELTPLDDGTLFDISPPDHELCIGVFDGLAIVTAAEFGLDRPSELPRHFLTARPGASVYLHAMHSVVDWCAFAEWRDGTLRRSLSVSAEQGVIEERGERLPHERPFWDGAHPAVDPEEEPDGYPLPFHPLELAEATLWEWFGFVVEGYDDVPASPLDLETVPLLRFQRRPRSAAAAPAPARAHIEVPPPPDVTAILQRRWWQFWRR